MNTRVCVLWHWLRSSFWFLPALMICFSVTLSLSSIHLDRVLHEHGKIHRWWAYGGDIEGGRVILSTIAGSMITIAGVVFSITIVVLSLASSQFGPRLIWNFMHDIANQVVLGTFISTFMYCLILLGRIRESGEIIFIPQISITIGILLGIADLGVLIYFIHHISTSIHANSVTAAVWRDLEEAIDRLFPDRIGHGPPQNEEVRKSQEIPEDFETSSLPVPANSSGYLEAINPEGLLRVASKNDLLLRLEYRPGHFITRGSPLASAWPGGRLNDELVDEINRSFILGSQRTPEQDVEFSVSQLAEIAVRSLSPGVNDPFTAISCIDWLGAALSDFAERRIPPPYRYDESNRLRIIAPHFTFPGSMDEAFNAIRQNSQSSPAVTIRLLESLAVIAAHITSEEHAASVMKHALMIKRGSEKGVIEEFDRKDVDERYEFVVASLHRRGYSGRAGR